MATCKITQDTRRAKDDGTAPIKLTISHKGRSSHISLGFSVSPKCWDAESCRVIKHPLKSNLNLLITNYKAKADEALLRLKIAGAFAGCSITQVRDKVKAVIFGKNDEYGAFWICVITFIGLKKKRRTIELYEATAKALEEFYPNIKNIDFESVNFDFLSRFDAWLQNVRNNSTNSRSIHLRNIRAIFNYAIDNEFTTCYPFRRFKIKQQATRKRSLKAAELRSIFAKNVEPWQKKYVDFIKLQFLLIGINTIDLLTNAKIVGGRLEYVRAKTGRHYSIKIEPEARELINRYKGVSGLLCFTDNISHYLNFASRLNKALHYISPNLSTYFMRHSWATIAAELEIPKETISAALGHGGNTVTDIYIDFNQKKVDEANRKVIDFVLHRKKASQKPAQ